MCVCARERDRQKSVRERGREKVTLSVNRYICSTIMILEIFLRYVRCLRGCTRGEGEARLVGEGTGVS